MSPQQVAEAFKAACMAELAALKPGNVHIFADGHGMVVQQFIQSAEAVATVIAQPGLTVGARILASINATWQVVDCNTNLGIVLLCAPLAQAALGDEGSSLRDRLEQVLKALTIRDAELAFQAIVRASPGGLGDSAQHDVRDAPQITLREAMRESAQRDRIAWQYAHEFADIFDFGISHYEAAIKRWNNPAWATTVLYLAFVAEFPDSHIVRKYDLDQAQEVQQVAKRHLQAMLQHENPKLYQRDLMQFDTELKSRRLNPGTSADLTVATLMAYSLKKAD
ncbi:triphosphoribosyl-dephospho-CoA synthase [Methylobacillus caricis]|uniref:triphosphoribosyl-dephospho-CoA synthase n=1 Tax=Methylobacillus caricis TaxID=1971611 RepID=UPI001CFF5D5B|nr:triphosphoribosyl-dephospho-CoA synthase [Methylobacillus caricis]MCB5187279.1 triphosphoribosyl-dephospho-CoA synthase [Methylobacillus caricis]